jgi:hypothetical protein
MAELVGAWALRAALLFGGACLVAACSDADSPRCAADFTLNQACAERDCPEDLEAALTAGAACDGRFLELWQEGERRAIGVSSGLGGTVYHFDGNQLAGVEFWSDELGDCPSMYVNGRRTVNVHAELVEGAPAPQVCALCSDWADQAERPLCP